MNDVEIVVARLDRDPNDHAALLSASELERARRFVFNRDRRRFIAGRAQLRRLLGERLAIHPKSVELTYGAHGKPAVANSALHFNVSHCDDLAVYAFSFGRAVGVDVESVRPMPEGRDIAARYFSQTENQAWLALDRCDRPVGFFNCWTRKEAFIKAIGDGLSYPLDRFDVSLAPEEPARILRVENTPGDECGWSIESFFPAPGFVAAAVVDRR